MLSEEPASTTVTVPVMAGWIVQKYRNVPASAKAKLNVWSLLRNPLSQMPFTDVAVWVVWSCWVHTIVPPTCTVTSWWVKFCIFARTSVPWPDDEPAVTVGVRAKTDDCVGVAVGCVGVVVEESLHPMRTTAAAIVPSIHCRDNPAMPTHKRPI